MPLVKNCSMSFVHFLSSCKFDVVKEYVEENLEVIDGNSSTVKIVVSGDVEEI